MSCSSPVYTLISDHTFKRTLPVRAKTEPKTQLADIDFEHILFIPAFIDNFMSSWGTITTANFRKYVSEWARDNIPMHPRYARVPTQFGDALRLEEVSIYSDIKFVSKHSWLNEPKENVAFEEWLHDAVILGALRHAHCALSGCSHQFSPKFTESQFFTDKVTTQMYANVAVFINKIAAPVMKLH